MKIYYLNDTDECQMLHKEDCAGENMKYLAPQEAHEFEVATKEGDGVFVKQWDGRILVGRINESAFNNFERRVNDLKTGSKTCGNCNCGSKKSCK